METSAFVSKLHTSQTERFCGQNLCWFNKLFAILDHSLHCHRSNSDSLLREEHRQTIRGRGKRERESWSTLSDSPVTDAMRYSGLGRRNRLRPKTSTAWTNTPPKQSKHIVHFTGSERRLNAADKQVERDSSPPASCAGDSCHLFLVSVGRGRNGAEQGVVDSGMDRAADAADGWPRPRPCHRPTHHHRRRPPRTQSG